MLSPARLSPSILPVNNLHPSKSLHPSNPPAWPPSSPSRCSPSFPLGQQVSSHPNMPPPPHSLQLQHPHTPPPGVGERLVPLQHRRPLAQHRYSSTTLQSRISLFQRPISPATLQPGHPPGYLPQTFGAILTSRQPSTSSLASY